MPVCQNRSNFENRLACNRYPLSGVPGNAIGNAGVFLSIAARPAAGPTAWPDRPVDARFLGRTHPTGPSVRHDEP